MYNQIFSKKLYDKLDKAYLKTLERYNNKLVSFDEKEGFLGIKENIAEFFLISTCENGDFKALTEFAEMLNLSNKPLPKDFEADFESGWYNSKEILYPILLIKIANMPKGYIQGNYNIAFPYYVKNLEELSSIYDYYKKNRKITKFNKLIKNEVIIPNKEKGMII